MNELSPTIHRYSFQGYLTFSQRKLHSVQKHNNFGSGYHSHQWLNIIFFPPLISHVISFNNNIDYFGQPFLIPSCLRASQNLNTGASSPSWIYPSWKDSWAALPWQDLHKSEKPLPKGHISISKQKNCQEPFFPRSQSCGCCHPIKPSPNTSLLFQY